MGTFISTQACKQCNEWGGNGEKDTSENLQPMSIYYVHALNQFVTYGQGATDFHAKPQKERKNRAREPL